MYPSFMSCTIFSLHFSSLIATHNLWHQQYADDTQLYIAVSPHIMRLSHQASPVSLIFTVGFHTTASV